MLWLAIHMWGLLFAAFAIGLGVGWWAWGARQKPRGTETAQAIGTLDIDYDPAGDAADGEKK